MRDCIARSRCGYSLGGNLALKLAGELGDAAPPQLAAVCAVSPTLDLARCVDALERRANYPYQWNFVRNLKARMRRKAAAFPADYSLGALGRVWTVRGRRGLPRTASRLSDAPTTITRRRDPGHRSYPVPALIVTAGTTLRSVEPVAGSGRAGNPNVRSLSRDTAALPYVIVPRESTTGTAERDLSGLLGAPRVPSASSELRTLPFFFVLEETTRRAPPSGSRMDVGPARDVRGV